MSKTIIDIKLFIIITIIFNSMPSLNFKTIEFIKFRSWSTRSSILNALLRK